MLSAWDDREWKRGKKSRIEFFLLLFRNELEIHQYAAQFISSLCSRFLFIRTNEQTLKLYEKSIQRHKTEGGEESERERKKIVPTIALQIARTHSAYSLCQFDMVGDGCVCMHK